MSVHERSVPDTEDRPMPSYCHLVWTRQHLWQARQHLWQEHDALWSTVPGVHGWQRARYWMSALDGGADDPQSLVMPMLHRQYDVAMGSGSGYNSRETYKRRYAQGRHGKEDNLDTNFKTLGSRMHQNQAYAIL